MRKFAFALAAILAASTVASCGGAPSAVNDTQSASDTTASPAEQAYPYYGDTDFGGKTFKILNVKYDLWNMMPQIMPEEQNGETVNDALWNRNVKVMEELNFVLEEEHHETYDELANDLNQLIMAGDDVYAAAYVPLHKILAGLTGGYYQKLGDVSTIHLEESYWDQTFLKASSIDGDNYFATGSAHLMINSGMWMLFFNEDMMEANKLTYPYDLVREGKWTLDAMRTYTKAVANLNGDDAFGKDSDGNAIYGFISFANVIPKFIYASGAEYVTKDKNGELVINCNSMKFVETCQKLAEFFGTQGEVFMASSDSTLNTYYQLYFEKQKCLFFGGELKTASLLRNMEQSFGIIPIPKIDESQSAYYVTSVHQCPAFVIPVTNAKPEDIGLIFDALSYESEATVLEPYFSEYVEQKGLRNEDSIEMLEIIKSSRSYDIGVVYGWINTLETALKTAIQEGNTDITSTIAANESSITESLNKMLEAFRD